MEKNIFNGFILFILLVTGCVNVQSSGKMFSKNINLSDVQGEKVLLYNAKVKIYLSLEDIKNQLNKVNLKNPDSLLVYLKSEQYSEVYLPENSFEIKTLLQEQFYCILYELLLEGKAEIINPESGNYLDRVTYLKTNNISGKKEHFQIPDGEIFMTKVLSLGE